MTYQLIGVVVAAFGNEADEKTVDDFNPYKIKVLSPQDQAELDAALQIFDRLKVLQMLPEGERAASLKHMLEQHQ